jgi:hypothetical protein
MHGHALASNRMKEAIAEPEKADQIETAIFGRGDPSAETGTIATICPCSEPRISMPGAWRRLTQFPPFV